jgi:hypothetical protein
MSIATAWENYVKAALSGYTARFGIGKDLDGFLKSGTGDLKRAFISYQGFQTGNQLEDGMVDLRVHEFTIFLNSKLEQITDVETLINYIQTHRQITATGITLTIGSIDGQYIVSDNGLIVFAINILTHSTNQLT